PSVHAQTASVAARPEPMPERVAPSAPAATASPDVAKPALDQPAAAPSDVWLVEKKPGYEFYSNGLRISTEHEVVGESRLYRTVARADGHLSEPKHLPMGLLYHTSEGDVIPFQSAYNRSLAQHSRELLYYIRQNRLYHYLIDRFGRVYRLVPDDAVAY